MEICSAGVTRLLRWSLVFLTWTILTAEAFQPASSSRQQTQSRRWRQALPLHDSLSPTNSELNRWSLPAESEPVGVVLVAGGIGKRMQAESPKQLLGLEGRPVLLHSLELFLELPLFSHIAVVLAPAYREDILRSSSLAQHAVASGKLSFADPGKERQDSVENGLRALPSSMQWICVHDAARPLVQPHELHEVVSAAKRTGAAILGVPVKSTIKEAFPPEDEINAQSQVRRTVNRNALWEAHTPQVVARSLLEASFVLALEHQWEVTDDASLVERLAEHLQQTVNLPGGCVPRVALVKGSYENIKITTPEDMIIASALLQNRKNTKDVNCAIARQETVAR